MRYTKWFASIALAGGMALASAGAASAQDLRWRHVDNDYARIEGMRNHIAQDRARLDEDIRCGRQQAATRDAADLARDQRALQAMRVDVHRDIRGYDDDDYRGNSYGYYRGNSSGYYRGYNSSWR
jgi:hypothetical protein